MNRILVVLLATVVIIACDKDVKPQRSKLHIPLDILQVDSVVVDRWIDGHYKNLTTRILNNEIVVDFDTDNLAQPFSITLFQMQKSPLPAIAYRSYVKDGISEANQAYPNPLLEPDRWIKSAAILDPGVTIFFGHDGCQTMVDIKVLTKTYDYIYFDRAIFDEAGNKIDFDSYALNIGSEWDGYSLTAPKALTNHDNCVQNDFVNGFIILMKLPSGDEKIHYYEWEK